MKPRLTTPTTSQPVILRNASLAALLFAIACSKCALAQSILVPPPPPPPERPTAPPETTEIQAPHTGESFTPAGPAAAPRQTLQWGSVIFHPHFEYSLTYGNGLVQSNREEKSFIHQISPGTRIDIGPRWSLDYTPNILIYSDKSFRDTVDHLINLSGGTTYNDWNFGLSQNCAITSDSQVQTGTQTDQETYTTGLHAGHQLNTALSLELGVNQNLLFAQNFESYRDWSTLDWLTYHWGPSLTTGLGVGFGYTDVDTGNDMTYEQLRARITWLPTHKIHFTVNGGAESRQFLTNNMPNLLSPVYGLSFDYLPFDNTSITLSVDHSVGQSYYVNQVVATTTLSAGIRQRFLGKYNADLTTGYTKSDYSGSAQGINSNGTDNYGYVRISVGRDFLKRGHGSVFYSFSKNNATRDGLSYSSDQVGLQLSYRY